MSRRAVFLDRDGTMIEDLDYLADPSRVRLLPGAGEAIRKLTAAGIPVIVVTNQSGIGRGYYTEADFQAVQSRVEDLVRGGGGSILATYHCPHSPEVEPACRCRKPAPGLFEKAAKDHDLDLALSSFVGDRLRDLEPGLVAGGSGFLIRGGEPTAERDGSRAFVWVDSLEEAVEWILRGDGPDRSD